MIKSWPDQRDSPMIRWFPPKCGLPLLGYKELSRPGHRDCRTPARAPQPCPGEGAPPHAAPSCQRGSSGSSQQCSRRPNHCHQTPHRLSWAERCTARARLHQHLLGVVHHHQETVGEHSQGGDGAVCGQVGLRSAQGRSTVSSWQGAARPEAGWAAAGWGGVSRSPRG